MQIYRVLIVDDSRFMRKVFSDMVNADDFFTVAGTASDGEEAVRLALILKPDIITMDLEMPRMNGLEALRRIMAARPAPVIMLSAVTDNGTRDTIRALQYGAVDFIRKPDSAVHLDISQVNGQLLEKLHIVADLIRRRAFRMLPAVEDGGEPAAGAKPAASRTPVERKSALSKPPPSQGPPALAKKASPPESSQPPGVRRASAKGATAAAAKAATPVQPAGRIDPAERAALQRLAAPLARATVTERRAPARKAGAQTAADPPPEKRKPRRNSSFTQIVAVGTSTGGPRALHEVLSKLPEDFEAPVLVVQHMPAKFTHSLAQRLDSFSAIRVCEASQGELVETATAYIAPGGKQMSLTKEPSGTYRIKLTEDGLRNGHMPSVDVLFESLVGHRGLTRHIVLMTGMGSDGAKGMKALQEDGAETRIVEAEETCVVYGMPRSAVELGAVSHVLPLGQIAAALVREVKSRNK